MSFSLNRFRADIILLALAVVWGAAFVAQKTAMSHIGPLTFSVLRYGLAAIALAPLALRELPQVRRLARRDWWALASISALFSIGTLIQQLAMPFVTVTNAGFLTTLYVILVPFAALILFRTMPGLLTIPAALLSLAGVFLLGGGSFVALSGGDYAIVFTAGLFAGQIALLGRTMQRLPIAATIVVLGSLTAFVLALPLALAFETIDWSSIGLALPEVLYTGIIAGALAFWLQATAQAHTPASDAAIIMSSESLFAALFAAYLLGERLPMIGWVGCGLIILAILLVELGPLMSDRATRWALRQRERPQGHG